MNTYLFLAIEVFEGQQQGCYGQCCCQETTEWIHHFINCMNGERSNTWKGPQRCSDRRRGSSRERRWHVTMLTWFDGRTLKRAFFINSCNFKATTKTILFTILYQKQTINQTISTIWTIIKTIHTMTSTIQKKYDFIVAPENFHCWPLSIFWGGEYRYFRTIYAIYNVLLTIYNVSYVLSLPNFLT